LRASVQDCSHGQLSARTGVNRLFGGVGAEACGSPKRAAKRRPLNWYATSCSTIPRRSCGLTITKRHKVRKPGLYSCALTLADYYVPFTDIGAAVMEMLAKTQGIEIDN
jgi:hypothetical protein